MKKILALFSLILLPAMLKAQIDETISYYSNSGNAVYFNSPAIDLQCARFEPKAPCLIKKVRMYMTGTPGSFRMRIFGYEAGDQIPGLRNDVIPPIKVTKTANGNQWIDVVLPKPVKFDNSWFWIGIDSLSTGVILLSDNKNVDSIPYNTYYYQAIHVPNSDPAQEWSIAGYAYYISVQVTYQTKTSPRYLKEVTDQSGIKKEALSSCIAAADYDEDGFIDLIANNKLYRNMQNGTFRDVTADLGIVNNHNPNYPGTALCQSLVDIDNDNDLDIVIFGYDTSVVFINDKGKFTEKILSLPPFHTYTYSPLLFNWADLNNDGYPDLVALQQASKYDSLGPDILPSYVFINDKNNDFKDESTRMFPDGHTFRRARASQFGDFDNDGDQDLYIGNYYLEKDELYVNDGDGNFVDIAPDKNLDVTNTGSMHDCGVNWFDYDNDGDLDLISARIAHSRNVLQYDHRGTVLYRNEGPPNYDFTDLTGQYNDYPGQISPIGLEYEDYHSSAAFADVNNDGLPDLLLKTYNPYRFISFYEQQPDHTFQMKRFEYGLDRIDAYGAGQVWMDYNNDGKIDLVMYNQNRISLFENTLRNGLNAVQFNLKCTSGNKYAIGARVTVYSGNQKFLREVSCGQDESVQFPYRQHIGLGNITKIDSVVVTWPTKPQKRDLYANLNVNVIYNLTEDGGISTTPVGIPIDKKYNLITKTYPNPFSQFSVISYELSASELVILKIYDEFGNEVRTLVNEIQDTGTHEEKFNADGLPQGSYYYKLTIGDKTEGQKVLLVR